MLQISEQRGSANAVVYQLAGEITEDQLPRLEALVRAAVDSGHELTLDVSRVWRVDRPTAVLLARSHSSSRLGVRLVGADQGLLAWLRSVADGSTKGSSRAGKEGTG